VMLGRRMKLHGQCCRSPQGKKQCVIVICCVTKKKLLVSWLLCCQPSYARRDAKWLLQPTCMYATLSSVSKLSKMSCSAFSRSWNSCTQHNSAA
jgi:hypothetical protein